MEFLLSGLAFFPSTCPAMPHDLRSLSMAGLIFKLDSNAETCNEKTQLYTLGYVSGSLPND
jgi:hypothetical protein